MTNKQWSKWLMAGGVTALVSTFLLLGGEEEKSVEKISFIGMAKTQKDSTVRAEIKNAKIGDEIVSLRTKNAQIRKVANGKMNIKIYSGDINYFDETDGFYKPIDLTVHEVSAEAKAEPDRLFDKYINAGAYRATWFNDKTYDYTFYKNDYWVKYTALFDTAGMNIETIPQNNGIKQNYIIREDTTITELRWLVETNAEYNSETSVFTDNMGKFLFRIPLPIAWDSKNNDIFITVSVVNDTLIYELDVSENVTYPITVDPTTEISFISAQSGALRHQTITYAGARDTSTATYIYTATVRAGQQFPAEAEYWVARGFLNFDLTSMSALSVIDSVHLVLDGQSDGSTTDHTIRVCSVNYHNTAIAVGWYKEFPGWAAAGVHTPSYFDSSAWNSSTYAAGANIFRFSKAGFDSVESAIADSFQCILLSGEDIGNSAPTDNEYVVFEGSGGTAPYLDIYYAIPNPTNFLMYHIDNDSIRTLWDDNASDETGYRIVEVDGGAYVDSVNADVDSLRIGGLDPNTSYQWKVQVKGGVYDGNESNADSTYTLPTIMPAPLATYTRAKTSTTHIIYIDTTGTSNPSYTRYVVQDSLSGEYIHLVAAADDTLGVAVDWNTLAAWGDSITVAIDSIGSTYVWRVDALSGQ